MIMENFNNTLDNVSNTLDTLENSCNAVCKVADSLSNIQATWADLQRDIHLMDVQFEAYMGTLEANLERHRINVPLISRQLDMLQDKMSRVLDRIIEKDVQTDMDMQEKSRLMDSLDSYVDKLSTLMIKLL